MDLLEYLRKIGVSEETIGLFKDGFLLRPKVDRVNNVIHITINKKTPVSFRTYSEVKSCFEDFLQMQIALNIAVEKLVPDNNLVMDYYLGFSNTNGLNELQKYIPVISDGKILLECEDPKIIEMLRELLKSVSIDMPIERKVVPAKQIIETRFDEPKPAEKPIRKPETEEKKEEEKYEAPVDVDRKNYLSYDITHALEATGKIATAGKVFKVDYREIRSRRNGTTINIQSIYITDYKEAIVIKRFESKKFPLEVMKKIKEGMVIKVYGTIKDDAYERMTIIEPDLIEELDIDPWKRSDDYEGTKHAELHVHTNRSDMDGVCAVGDMIQQAYNFGQKAIAITDINVVQAYPLAQSKHEDLDKKNPDNDFKVIYGIEMKVAPDKLSIVYNPTDDKLSEVTYCVFDLETTGLSTRYDYIIEFGGCKVVNGVLQDKTKFQLFVKPPVKLPPFITYKTNITDQMLENALPIEEAIDKILDYIGDDVLVAHNASFDYNFLNDKLKEMGRKPLTNPCIDTLDLAKQLVKNRKYYRLGLIAKNYHIEYNDEEAHRGDYDAEVLARVFCRMLDSLENYKTMTLNDLQNQQDEDSYKKTYTYNMSLLAKNMAGIKKIYELVSLAHTKYLTYFAKENAKKADNDVVAEPRIIFSEIEKRRDDLLIGSCNYYSELFEFALNRSQEDLEKCMKFYDFIEIQPLDCYRPLIEPGAALDEMRMQTVVENIVATADKLGIPVIGTNDVFYINPEQKMVRDIYIMAKRIGGSRHPLFPLNRERRLKFVAPNQHMMTTKEMLEAFSFLGEEKAKQITIDNPADIVSRIDKLYPIPRKLATPTIEGCEDILKDVIYKNAYETYGDPLPQLVADRIGKELNSVITNGFSVQYYLAYLLVKMSNEDGYVVGSRGSVGSSFIATMAGITEVNPLVPHYVCPNCHHSEFFTNGEYLDGIDMPDKNCPVCGMPMKKDGHDIPFETFLGFKGDKVPDIDLNFSPDNQNTAQLRIRDLFGEDNAFRAGTISAVADKTAYGYVKGYCEEMELLDGAGQPTFSKAYQELLATEAADVKRSTGQHPGGIVVIPKDREVHDFTPIQYPANNPFADWKTTHFAFADLHDNILKLDILGHIDPMAIYLLQKYTGIDPKTIPLDDPKTLSLFYSTDAMNIIDHSTIYNETNGGAGLPEFGTRNNRNILDFTKPHTFSELVALSGLTHGTNVWKNNAEELIKSGICQKLNETIACRDDIMIYLISKGLQSKMSFDIMESVRKGRGLKPEWEEEMSAHEVPDWYIDSCKKIEYMFPKAHAVA
ncbi:MAG: PolC-type DNA polymerase III, partial [Erysipelotrichaceae bacterium]|nr:PolC-type DNA polymerase III [Erysipelotrichaceae bacterium]